MHITKIELIIFVLLINLFVFHGNTIGSEKGSDYTLINYKNPNKEFLTPLSIQGIILHKEHQFFAGNEEILNRIRKNIAKLESISENKKSGYPGYFLSLTLYKNSIVQYNLYIQRDRSFILETAKKDIKGVMDKKTFDDFISLCERMTDIIDYKYQWQRLK